jgi:hypothetical protein
VPERPLRILFFLYHAGYLRHYAEPLRLLARDGHVIHLGFTVVEKGEGDTELAARLAAEFPQVTYGPAPVRGYFDGWRRTSTLVRAFTDLARYMHPRYAHSPALRTRMAAKIRLHVQFGKSDPLSSWAVTRIVDSLARRSDAGSARRALRFLAACERAIPTSRRIDAFVRAFDPDVVLATPLVEYASNQVDYLKSGRRHGASTAAAIASWDNLTNKGMLRFTPDRVLIWNEAQRRELEELHGIDGARAVVTGAQKFDDWFERTPTRDPEAFRARVGLRAGTPFVLYVCSSSFIAPDELSFVRRWLADLRSDPRFAPEQLGVVVRPHPQNTAQWLGVDLAEEENVVVWPAGGAQPDAGDARADFFDSLAHAAAVVGVNTSVMIEAAIVGRTVLTLLDPAFAATQEGTLHFHHLLRENGGFLEIARSFDEHREQLAGALEGGTTETERVQAFIGSFVRPHGLDVPAAPLVAAAIEELARETPTPQTSPRPAARLLRLALLVPTVVATASTLVGLVLHRLAGRARGGQVSASPPA